MYIKKFFLILLLTIFISSCSSNTNNNITDDKKIFDIGGIEKINVEKSDKIELYFYGVFDTTDQMYPLINKYEQENPNVKIVYKKINYSNYDYFTYNEIINGSGPDIFMIHNTNVNRFLEHLLILNDVLPEDMIKKDFVQAVYKATVKNNIVVAVCNSVDTLAIIYNPHLTKNPPKTWAQIDNFLSIYDREAPYIALGDIYVDYYQDIILSILKQKNGEVYDSVGIFNLYRGTNIKYNDVINYYISFLNKGKLPWADVKKNNFEKFIDEKLAIFIGYNFQYQKIKEYPIMFAPKVSYYPQLDIVQEPSYFASFWVYAGNKNTKYPNEVKKFLKYLSEKEQILKYHVITNKPVSRYDLISVTEYEEDNGIWAKQLINADFFDFKNNDYRIAIKNIKMALSQ